MQSIPVRLFDLFFAALISSLLAIAVLPCQFVDARSITINSVSPSVHFSQDWSRVSDGKNTSVVMASNLGARVQVSLPVGTSAFNYTGLKGPQGGLYQVCLDCHSDGGFTSVVDAYDATDAGDALSIPIFSMAGLDPSVPHVLEVSNVLDSRFNGTGQISFSELQVTVQDGEDAHRIPLSSTVSASFSSVASISSASDTLSISFPYVSVPFASSSVSPARYRPTRRPLHEETVTTTQMAMTASSTGSTIRGTSTIAVASMPTASSLSGVRSTTNTGSTTFSVSPTFVTSWVTTFKISPTSLSVSPSNSMSASSGTSMGASTGSITSSMSSLKTTSSMFPTPFTTLTFLTPSSAATSMSSASLSTTDEDTATAPNNSLSASVIAVIAMLSFVGVLSLIVGIFFFFRRRQRDLARDVESGAALGGPRPLLLGRSGSLPVRSVSSPQAWLPYVPGRRPSLAPNSTEAGPTRPRNPYVGIVHPSTPLLQPDRVVGPMRLFETADER